MEFKSKVESYFYKQMDSPNFSTNIPYLTVNNFPRLGFLTALRFLEWVNENPEGVISLPTGKTPEYFIVWTKYLLEKWDTKKGKEIRERYGLEHLKKPSLNRLRFVQIDEFYPISSEQHNSFYNYVSRFYLSGFGLDPKKSLLINSDTIPLYNGDHFSNVFPDYKVDLSLRYREPTSPLETIQQKSIFLIDDWCKNYEEAIRNMGGIGFFWVE